MDSNLPNAMTLLGEIGPEILARLQGPAQRRAHLEASFFSAAFEARDNASDEGWTSAMALLGEICAQADPSGASPILHATARLRGLNVDEREICPAAAKALVHRVAKAVNDRLALTDDGPLAMELLSPFGDGEHFLIEELGEMSKLWSMLERKAH